MGLFGDSGLFGKMFDFNGDGKVDCFEQSMELVFLNELTKDAKDDFDEDDLDSDMDDDW